MTIEQMKENTPNYFKFNIVYKQVDWIQLLDFHVKAEISSTSRTQSHRHQFPQFCTIIKLFFLSQQELPVLATMTLYNMTINVITIMQNCTQRKLVLSHAAHTLFR